MQGSVWRWIERVSWWLEDANERQTVLGDIQERGVSFSALLEVIGLVLLRQLQAWKSWRPWWVTASLILPLAFLPGTMLLWTKASYMGWRWIDHQNVLPFVENTLMTFILAYGIGFNLGTFGRRTALTILPLAATFSIFKFAPAIWNVFTVDVDLRGVVILFLAGAFWISLPLGFGLSQSLRGQRLGRIFAIGIAALFLTMEGYSSVIAIRFAPWRYVQMLPLSFVLYWPILYTLSKAIFPRRRSIPVQPGL
jgi:hypothetical protein